MKRIYCAIGKLVEVTQHIEQNIIDIIEKSEIIKEFGRRGQITLAQYNQVIDDANYLKEKMETMTFGQMISIVYESESLNRDEINQLKVLLEKRNYFTHEYFKYTNYDGMGEEFILEEFEAIKQYLKESQAMLNKLELIKKGQIERLTFLKNKAGIN